MRTRAEETLRALRHQMHKILGDSPKLVRLVDASASHSEDCQCDFCRRAEMRWEETP